MAGKGANAVRAAILGAPPATPTATPPAPLPEYLANRFSMNEKGLWLKDPDGGAMWICAAFEVLAETRDDAGLDRGLWVGFHDREGGRHEMALPFTTLVGDGGDARGRLAYAGLRQNPHAKARQAFLEYLNAVTPTAFARCVPAIGWHQISGERVYVTPSRIYGTTTERIIFQPAERAGSFHERWNTGGMAGCSWGAVPRKYPIAVGCVCCLRGAAAGHYQRGWRWHSLQGRVSARKIDRPEGRCQRLGRTGVHFGMAHHG